VPYSRPFRPLPFLGNPHVQTVLSYALSWGRDHVPATLRTLSLPDGDALALHDSRPPAWTERDAIAILVHGLGGCHRSTYLRRTANRLTAHGLRVVRVDLRGAGAGVALARRFYNAACSADIGAVVEAVAAECPRAPLFLVGFSLGGNIVLKLAGEAGASAPSGLRGIAAVAPPIDLVRCAELIARLPLYDRFYVRQLVQQVEVRARTFPDLPSVRFPAGVTLRQFDDLFTAPNWGYANALDYYRRASALQLLPKIAVPCLMLSARDDPFVAWQPFTEFTPGPDTSVELVQHGGHLGFLGGDGNGGVRWAEARVVQWVLERCRLEAR
jgi:predicted alpha/beta-fold hydrolase